MAIQLSVNCSNHCATRAHMPWNIAKLDNQLKYEGLYNYMEFTQHILVCLDTFSIPCIKHIH